MVNETLQDIFDEFYAREAKLEANREIQQLNEENDDLREEINNLEDDIYDRNDQIEDMNSEIRKAQHACVECMEAMSKIQKQFEELNWHLQHAEQDW